MSKSKSASPSSDSSICLQSLICDSPCALEGITFIFTGHHLGLAHQVRCGHFSPTNCVIHYYQDMPQESPNAEERCPNTKSLSLNAPLRWKMLRMHSQLCYLLYSSLEEHSDFGTDHPSSNGVPCGQQGHDKISPTVQGHKVLRNAQPTVRYMYVHVATAANHAILNMYVAARRDPDVHSLAPLW